MRTVTIAALLLLLAIAAMASGCPRKAAGDATNVSIDESKPADTTTTTADSTTPAAGGDTKVDINVNQGDKSSEQTEGDKTGGDKSADDNGGDKSAAGDTGKTEEKPAEPAKEDPNVTTVILETSKGNITLAVHKDWAPIGAAHFIELVNAKYYDGAPWFRVVPGFMAQIGIAADPAVTKKWQDITIQDEPVKQGNKRGMVSFGQSSAPNSRSTHFFINYVDNSMGLDRQGFACFAEVTEGMDVADKLFPTGDGTVDQGKLSAEGISYFRSKFPQGDTVTRAYVKEAK